MNKDNLLIIAGPTGVGKSELSIELAEKYNGEIISADSMQIYKKMDIGTAKVDYSNSNIKHHMLDIVDFNENFSVSDFQKKAKSLIKDINIRGKLPIVVGGTGLYINSLCYNLTFQNQAKDVEYRKELEDTAANKGIYYLYKKLEKIDPDSAKKIDPNNKNRIIRALEINKTSTKENNRLREENNDYNLLYICLYMDRKKLYDKINNRVDKMIKLGLIDETKDLIKDLDDYNFNSLKAIGYKEVISYLNSEISLDECIDLIKRNSRRYAKRQFTWFRRDERVIWINKDCDNWKEDIENLMGEKFKK